LEDRFVVDEKLDGVIRRAILTANADDTNLIFTGVWGADGAAPAN